MKEPIDIKKISFDELKKLFQKRIFAIPEIQREFVWTKRKIIDLLDSIKKHYPIGSFLICKVPSKMAKHISESAVLPKFDSKNNKECYVVVDGQQRLSVLYSIINGKKISDTTRYYDGIDFMQICISPRQDKESEFDFYRTDENSHIKLFDILNDRVRYRLSKGKEKRVNLKNARNCSIFYYRNIKNPNFTHSGNSEGICIFSKSLKIYHLISNFSSRLRA